MLIELDLCMMYNFKLIGKSQWTMPSLYNIWFNDNKNIYTKTINTFMLTLINVFNNKIDCCLLYICSLLNFSIYWCDTFLLLQLECFCGKNSTCLFEDDEKLCFCPEDQQQSNGTCIGKLLSSRTYIKY